MRRTAALRLRGVVVWSAVGLFALPLLLLLSAPWRRPGAAPPTGVELIPADPSVQGFIDAWTLVPMGSALWNSIWICLWAVPLSLTCASLAALALTQLSGRLRILLIATLLLSAVVPITAIWIPRFLLFDLLGLVGGPLPLIAPALMGGSPLFVLLYFVSMRRIPSEIFEAARMEGAGWLRIWWSVAMPMVKPTTGAIAMLAWVLFWGNFIDPLLYLRDEKSLTAPPMLHQLELLGPTNWPVYMAGALLISAPVALLFLAAQRFLWKTQEAQE